MPMSHLDDALQAIAGSDRARFIGPRDPALVASAEQALDVAFPPTYRRFVLELGAGSVGGREFYGVTTDNFTSASVPNGVWLTLDERWKFDLAEGLVIIGETGLGEYYVLDTRHRTEDGECPVVLWVPGVSDADGLLTSVAPDFGAFLLDAVEEVFGAHGSDGPGLA
ncbi:SMI1/KNR4 family protein [Salsipaludibacter albus]|uniref:SMI1/KNR4 family protein n=1 Tax=Salsipaludibacter albus TaxID=2849650 RepID=UPI001EE44301|nr:SMI1/KNR4 family protein [Salsipaludibacter albus]MBY5162886.1 SMI1/KNR4 family protein [Salsipaludibacter albus]